MSKPQTQTNTQDCFTAARPGAVEVGRWHPKSSQRSYDHVIRELCTVPNPVCPSAKIADKLEACLSCCRRTWKQSALFLRMSRTQSQLRYWNRWRRSTLG